MKKLLVGVVSLALSLGLLSSAPLMAEEVPGVAQTEVVASQESPTGYYVTFRYAGEAERVRLQGQWTFSGDRYLNGAPMYPVQPDQWQNGYFVDGNFEIVEMEKNEEGVFEYTMPLPNGTFSYWFFLNGDEGTETSDVTGASQTFDPALPPMVSEGMDASNLQAGSNRSHIYIPLDSSKVLQDRTIEAPRTDGIEGTILYESVEVPNGEETITEPFGIYLPYGFDKERDEPYKVVVLSHGMNGDEFNWPNNGCAKNILDNLYGTIEDTVFVFPNNTIFSWDLELIHTSIVDCILPFMVENYNVSEKVEDRVMAGLSMGGMTTTYLMTYHTNDFSAYYPMSGSNFGVWEYTDEAGFDDMKNVDIAIFSAFQAFDYSDVLKTTQLWTEKEISYNFYVYDGGHTWEIWRKCLEDMVRYELWK